MNTKEAIEKLSEYQPSFYTGHIKCTEVQEIIEVLKRGEKYEEIVEELNNLDFMSNKEKLLMNYEDFANLLTKLKQKYFPKDEVVK